MYAVYDVMADDFDRRANESPWNALYDQPTVRTLLDPDLRGRRLVDVGCGNGVNAHWMIEQGATVVGIDASRELLARARQRLGPAVELHHDDMNQPVTFLDAGSFDGALCTLVLDHLTDRGFALVELRRLLAPGGYLVVSCGHPMTDWLRSGGDYFTANVVTDRWQLYDGRTVPVSYWRRSLGEMCAEFTDAGFVVERLVEHRPDPAMRTEDPELYQRLEVRPAFLAVRLRPRDDSPNE